MLSNAGKGKLVALAVGCTLAFFIAGSALAKDDEVEKRKQKVKELSVSSGNGSVDQEMRSKEREIASKISESITLLKRLIKKNKGMQLPDLYFRLAEGYWQYARYRSFILQDEYEQKQKRYDEMVKRGVKNLKLPSPDFSDVEKYKRLAIKVYGVIIKKYPSYAKLDRAYFFAAYNFNDLHETVKAEKLYLLFVKKFPRSEYWSDGVLALGEIYFNRGEMEKAIARYKQLIDLGGERCPYYNYAIYKSGWTYYNLQQYDAAVESFQKVVEFEDRDRRRTRKINLKEEALNDLVLAFSEVGDIEAAQTYFKGLGESRYFHRLLERLGFIYFEQGKFKQSASAFKRLLKAEPYGPKAPEYQNKIVDAFRRLQERDQTNEEMALLVSRYHPKSAWARKNEKDAESLQQARKMVENTLRLLATSYHHEAKKTLRDQTYDLAVNNYKLYLAYFADSEAAYEMRFYYAQLLFERKDFRAAADQYRQVATDNPRGKYLKDAALNAMVSYEEQLKRDQPQFPNKTKDITPKPVSEIEKSLVGAIDLFAKLLPGDEKTPEALLQAGTIYYNYNQFDDAIKRLEGVVERWPSRYVAVEASRLVLSSYNWQKKYLELNGWARKAFKNPVLKNQKLRDSDKEKPSGKLFGEELYGLIKTSAFTHAGETEAKNDYAGAAKEYIEFEKEFPQSEFADKALYNVAVNYQRLQNLSGMIEIEKKMIATYPKSPLTPKIIYMVGSKQEQNVDFIAAATTFELLAKQYPDFEQSSEALLASALYREAENRFADSYRSLALMIEKYPKRKDLKDVRIHMGELLEKQKRYLEAIDAYREVLQAFPDDRGLAVRVQRSIGTNYMNYGNPEKAKYAFKLTAEAFEKLPAAQRNKDENRYQLGEAKFMLADSIYQQYKHGRPSGDEKSYAAGIERRFKLLSELEKAYLEVVEVKSTPWAIKSLCRLGGLYQEHAVDYQKAPISPKLKENQVVIYKDALEKEARSFLKSADQFYQACLEKGRQLDFFTEEAKSAEVYFIERDPSWLVTNMVWPIKFENLVEYDFLFGRLELK